MGATIALRCLRQILRRRQFSSGLAEYLYRGGIGAIGATALCMTSLSASDFDITTTSDSGVGSVRDALSQVQSGDRLVFQSNLNGKTLDNGSPFVINTGITFTDANSTTAPVALVLTDNHAYTLAPSLTTTTTVGKNTTTLTTPVPLTVNWAGTLTLNGILGDSTTNSGSLAKSGTGTLVLTNANTYTGGTTITGGTLLISNSQALGTGALTATGAGTLDFSKSINLTNAITLSTNTTLTVNSAAGTTNQLSGIISVPTGGGTGTAGILNLTGDGTLILSSANTFTGGIHVTNNGTISILDSAALGTGTVTTTGAATLNLADGLLVANKISLGMPFTANVSSGTATLSGAISDTSTTVSDSFTKTGAGTLILTGTNTYKGGNIISQGTLQGNSNSLPGNITNNASLIFNQTATGTYTGVISGTGTMTKTGNGTLSFNGHSTLPTVTNILAGGFQLNGTVASSVNVANSMATLSGTGTVGTVTNNGDVTNNGTVQPGTTSIGVLTINGDYIQQSGGTTQIKINSGGNAPGVNNDELKISGQAKLDGVLKVLALDPTYTPGTRYTIMTDTGGVTSVFSQASTNISTYGALVSYGPDTVTFELKPTTSLRAAALTTNQSSVGTALDGIALSTSGTSFANGPLFSMINSMGIQSPDQQRQGMNQLGGSMFANLQTVGLQVGNQFQQLVTNTLVNNGLFLAGELVEVSSGADVRGQSPTADPETTRGWMQGFGVNGHLRSDGNSPSLNYGQGGAVFGVDGGRDDTGVVGIAGGTSYVELHDTLAAKGQITSYQLGAYGLKQDDLLYNIGTVSYGYNSYFTNRDISVAGSEQRLHANYSGNQLGASSETGLKLVAGPFHIQPLVGLQYLYLCQQGLEESGGAAGLSVNRTRGSSLRANVGARILLDPWTGPNGAVWTPYTHARFISELLDNDRIINASFTGAPTGGAFTTHGTGIGYSYGVFGEGLEMRISDWWSLIGNADVLVGDRMTITTGSVASISRW